MKRGNAMVKSNENVAAMFSKENLLAGWKRWVSHMKRDWELDDYPVIVREQEIEATADVVSPGGSMRRYMARIVNWWVMTSFGDTPEEALDALRESFRLMKEHRQQSGKAMPRPGIEVLPEFAPSDRVFANPELTDDFIRRVLEVDWAFVSDGTSLSDFHGEETNDRLYAKIYEIYGVDVSDVKSGNLAEILERIAEHRGD